MRVQVVGQGMLAAVYQRGCQDRVSLVTEDPDVLWVCYDTPVHGGVADSGYVTARIAEHLTTTPTTAIVLLSSQLPVGTCALLEEKHPQFTFVVNPENIRRAHGLEDFKQPYRHIVGSRKREPVVQELLANWANTIVWMTPESAEMSKHALNGYLALCIRFGNELGALCRKWGANPDDVLMALLSERRVSYYAPIAPGDPPSQHLMREVHNLINLGGGPVMRALA